MTSFETRFGDLEKRSAGIFFVIRSYQDPTCAEICFIGNELHLAEPTGRRIAGLIDSVDPYALLLKETQVPRTEPVAVLKGFLWPFEAVQCRMRDGSIVTLDPVTRSE